MVPQVPYRCIDTFCALSQPPQGESKSGALKDESFVANSVLVPLKIHTSLGLLSFLSTTTVFGTPVDVTLSELAIEMFFPADAATAEAVRARITTG